MLRGLILGLATLPLAVPGVLLLFGAETWQGRLFGVALLALAAFPVTFFSFVKSRRRRVRHWVALLLPLLIPAGVY